MPGEHAAQPYERRRGMLRSPVLDLTQGVHRRDTTSPMEPWSHHFAGRLDEHVFRSEVLKDNPLRDPHDRPLWVYVPPGYDDDANQRYPSVYVIQGMTGQLDMWRNRSAFRKNFPESRRRRREAATARPASSSTSTAGRSYGGSQFLDSPGTGRYHTYLCQELVPWVDTRGTARSPARAPRDRRQVERRLRRDGHADAAARPVRRDGDACRRRAVRGLLPAGVPRKTRALSVTTTTARTRSGGRTSAPARPSRSAATSTSDQHLVMAACYSADEDGTVRLPFDTATGELVPEVWERWLAWDPVRMVPRTRMRSAR